MRKLELVWNKELMQYEEKFVYHEENIPAKNKRYRGKNKISNFQDKQRVKRESRKGFTNWQYTTQITHTSRLGTNPELKYINNWV